MKSCIVKTCGSPHQQKLGLKVTTNWCYLVRSQVIFTENFSSPFLLPSQGTHTENRVVSISNTL